MSREQEEEECIHSLVMVWEEKEKCTVKSRWSFTEKGEKEKDV